MPRETSKVTGKVLVTDWYALRVRVDNEEYLDRVKTLIPTFSAGGAYVICMEKEEAETNSHVHCLFYSKLNVKTLRNRLTDSFKNVVGGGNQVYSLKIAEYSFKMAAAYTCKDRNVVIAYGLEFTPERIEEHAANWAAHKKEQCNKPSANDRSLKMRVLDKLRKDDVKPHMKEVIGRAVYDEIHDSQVIYSLRQMQDLCLFLQIQLSGKAESFLRNDLVEQMTRFLPL